MRADVLKEGLERSKLEEGVWKRPSLSLFIWASQGNDETMEIDVEGKKQKRFRVSSRRKDVAPQNQRVIKTTLRAEGGEREMLPNLTEGSLLNREKN